MKKQIFSGLVVLLGGMVLSAGPTPAICTADGDDSVSIDRDANTMNESFVSSSPARTDSEFKLEFKLNDLDTADEESDADAATEMSSESSSQTDVPVSERQFTTREAYLDAIANEVNSCSN
jgi:hypothetical protein